MEIYYSSMYIKEDIKSFNELIDKIAPQEIELYLDANICIYIREFIREPQTIIGRKDKTLWSSFERFIWNVKKNDISLEYSFGIDEASRNKGDFEINNEKLNELLINIAQFSQMSYYELIEYSKLTIDNPPSKDWTFKTKTKFDSLENVSRHQKILYLTYAGLLKLYILDRTKQNESNVQLMKQYIDFFADEVDMVSVSNLAFAYHYLNEGQMKKIIHDKPKTTEDEVHALWNAAIDLTLPALISRNIKFLGIKKTPVFVTSDKKLWTFYNTLKVNTLFTNNGQIGGPPIIEVNLAQANWKQKEVELMHKYYMSKMRIYKFLREIDEYEFINKMREICYGLEIEARKYMQK